MFDFFKLIKSSGPDFILAEHILFTYPSLVIHLKLLFSFLLVHSYVPDSFGFGLILYTKC